MFRPGGDLLSRALRRSTIGAEGFHGRVRDGIGCIAPRCGHQAKAKIRIVGFVFFKRVDGVCSRLARVDTASGVRLFRYLPLCGRMVVSLFRAEAVGRDLPVGYSIADLSEDRP